MIEPIPRLQTEDVSAIDQVLDRVVRAERPVVYAVLAAAVWNRSDAEELTQEVFSRSLPRLRGDPELLASPRRYLITAARNLVRDRARRRRVLLLDPSELGRGEPDRVHGSPEEQLLAAERRMLLASALAELPADQCHVLKMRFLELRSTEEVAIALRRSRGAVRQLQRRALAEVRRIASDWDEEE